MSRLGVVVNPTAGRGHGRGDGRRAIEMLLAAGHDVVDLSGPNLPLAMESARAAATAGTLATGTTTSGTATSASTIPPLDALVVVGGDGMVHLGVNAVAGTQLPLGIVAVGSGNDFAAALGLPTHDVPAALAGIETALLKGPRAVDTAHVTRLDSPEEPSLAAGPGRWFCGVLSAGLDAAVNARANSLAWPHGSAKYVRAVAGELLHFAPYGYRVTLEGPDGAHVWESPGTLVAVANGPRIGGGIRIAPDAQVDDGLLDVVLAGPFSRLGAAGIFPSTYRGRHVDHSRVSVFRATTVTIEPTTHGRVPPPAFADGEHVGHLPLRVDVHPGTLRVLAPRRALR